MLKNCRSQNYAKFTSKLGKGSVLIKNTGFKPAKFSGLDNIIEFFGIYLRFSGQFFQKILQVSFLSKRTGCFVLNKETYGRSKIKKNREGSFLN